MAGNFTTSTGKDGKFYFNLKASNGQVILSSQGYTVAASRDNGIASVRAHAGDNKNFARLVSDSGQPYFTLNASNSQVIGRSQMYASDASRDAGVASVANHAADAAVVAA
jgi:uncharacterized protein